MQDDGLNGDHFGNIVHGRDGIEEVDFFAEAKGVAHFEKGVAANVAFYSFFVVIENENGVGSFDFFKMFADKVILDFGTNSFFVAAHVGLVFVEVIQFGGGVDDMTALL